MHHIMPQPLSWRTRFAILLPLLLMSAMPLVIYFSGAQETHLVVMLIVMIVVQAIISIRTAKLAAGMISKLHKMSGNGSLLALADIKSRYLSWYVWLSTLRLTWIDHAMLAIPRLGLALGFVQFFHSSRMWTTTPIRWDRPFSYYSYNHWGGFPPKAPEIYPDLTQLIIALIILSILAIGNGALIAAFAAFWGSLVKDIYAIILVIGSYLVLIIIILSVYLLLTNIMQIQNYNPHRNRLDPIHLVRVYNNNICAIRERAIREGQEAIRARSEQYHQDGTCRHAKIELTLLRSIEATQVALSSFVDHGALLGANILRPINRDNDEAFGYFGFYYDSEWNEKWSYWPFVLRNIISALLAISIHAVLIFGTLQITRWRLRHMGFI